MKTQKELILDYVKTFGEIIPAKIGGKPWNGGFFGSETSKRCRELRQAGMLTSYKEGKFEVYKLPEFHSQAHEAFKPILNSLFPVDQINYR